MLHIHTVILVSAKSAGDPSFIHVNWKDGEATFSATEGVQVNIIELNPSSPLITAGASDAVKVGAAKPK